MHDYFVVDLFFRRGVQARNSKIPKAVASIAGICPAERFVGTGRSHGASPMRSSKLAHVTPGFYKEVVELADEAESERLRGIFQALPIKRFSVSAGS